MLVIIHLMEQLYTLVNVVFGDQGGKYDMMICMTMMTITMMTLMTMKTISVTWYLGKVMTTMTMMMIIQGKTMNDNDDDDNCRVEPGYKLPPCGSVTVLQQARWNPPYPVTILVVMMMMKVMMMMVILSW